MASMLESPLTFDASQSTRNPSFGPRSSIKPPTTASDYSLRNSAWSNTSSIWLNSPRYSTNASDTRANTVPRRSEVTSSSLATHASFSTVSEADQSSASWTAGSFSGAPSAVLQSSGISPSWSRTNGQIGDLQHDHVLSLSNSTLLNDSAPDNEMQGLDLALEEYPSAQSRSRFLPKRQPLSESQPFGGPDRLQKRTYSPRNASPDNFESKTPSRRTFGPPQPTTYAPGGGLDFNNAFQPTSLELPPIVQTKTSSLQEPRDSSADFFLDPGDKHDLGKDTIYPNGAFRPPDDYAGRLSMALDQMSLHVDLYAPHRAYLAERQALFGAQRQSHEQAELSEFCARPSHNGMKVDLDGADLPMSTVASSQEFDQQYPTPYFRAPSFGDRGTSSPLTSDYRGSHQSPYYSGAGTPPTAPDSIRSAAGSALSGRLLHGQAVQLEKRLRNLEPYQQEQPYGHHTPIPSLLSYPSHHDYPGTGISLRMNPLADSYAVTNLPNLPGYARTNRYSSRGPEPTQMRRSAVLEDFRLNSKTNKRYELRDVYDHVVEFSGDQHGSRFLQQKLETANSDEKEQMFAEILPNSLQLMTDVFGNYVIQKMFEHGNQSQKKVLANQMKGHIFSLSMQMYGCRVVQKALEHILTDQQASVVRELEGKVLQVVKDQNGNHVVQKAIERVPGEHIQFIIDAHKGHVPRLAMHTYGCRVIQRMLEHCQPHAKRAILDELHDCVAGLIPDQFGNYVIQHVIENGEAHDRARVVSIVQQQLLPFSRHKFASNVVEKSIDFAEDGQRAKLLRQLVEKDATGQSQVYSLIRDQYGNYVIQKVLAHLTGPAREALVHEIKEHLIVLKRFSYGKQVIALEKLILDSNASPRLSPTNRGSHFSSSTSNNIEGTLTGPSYLNQPRYHHLHPVALPIGPGHRIQEPISS